MPCVDHPAAPVREVGRPASIETCQSTVPIHAATLASPSSTAAAPPPQALTAIGEAGAGRIDVPPAPVEPRSLRPAGYTWIRFI
jgi:hypothetical protein